MCIAHAQAAQRALVVAREKASNEAKSEFMSLMCHEVRTPLNGCLASAEMLLETALEVCPLPQKFIMLTYILVRPAFRPSTDLLSAFNYTYV